MDISPWLKTSLEPLVLFLFLLRFSSGHQTARKSENRPASWKRCAADSKEGQAVNLGWVNISTCLANALGRLGVQTVGNRCRSMCLPLIVYSASAHLEYTNFAGAELGLRASPSVVLAESSVNNDRSLSIHHMCKNIDMCPLTNCLHVWFYSSKGTGCFLTLELRGKLKINVAVMPKNLRLYSLDWSIPMRF